MRSRVLCPLALFVAANLASCSPSLNWNSLCWTQDADGDGQRDDDESSALLAFYADGDADGFGDAGAEPVEACSPPEGFVLDDTDCDDDDPEVWPGAAELCDGVDNDCDGSIDPDESADALTWYTDDDGDGFGAQDGAGVRACASPGSGLVDNAADCDDADAGVSPEADEYCDDTDSDCDGEARDAESVDALTWYADADADGHGDPDAQVTACDQPDGHLQEASDCDDSAPEVQPGAWDDCGDGVDGDCDGVDRACELGLTDADAKLLGENNADGAGWSVASAGDLNDDGISDLLIGAPDEETGGESAGAVYLVSGAVDGINELANTYGKLVGEEAIDNAGGAVAGLGDVDGDGVDDALVGAEIESTAGDQAGAVYLIAGPVAGEVDLSAAVAKLTGEVGGDRAGGAVASAGDTNGDGLAELLIGAEDASVGGEGAGAAYYFSGPLTGTRSLATADVRLYGEAEGDYLGASVSTAGDVDSSGGADWMIGAWGSDVGGDGAGIVYLFFDNPTADTDLSDVDARLIGALGDGAGLSLYGGLDVDDDGADDLLIGAPGDSSVASFAGAVYVVLAQPAGDVSLTEADAKLVGLSEDAYAGYSVSGADVDGDGFGDVIVGAPGASSGGTAYLVLGPVSGTIDLSDADAALTGEASGDSAAWAVAGVPDTDGDGRDELLIGAFGESTNGSQAGAAYLVRGGSF